MTIGPDLDFAAACPAASDECSGAAAEEAARAGMTVTASMAPASSVVATRGRCNRTMTSDCRGAGDSPYYITTRGNRQTSQGWPRRGATKKTWDRPEPTDPGTSGFVGARRRPAT